MAIIPGIMKKLFSITLYFFFLCNVILSQDFWMELDTPDSVSILKIEISPEGDIQLGTTKGIYFSQDEGLTWIKLGDLNIGVSNIENYSDGEMCAGADYLFNSIDQGQSWNLVHSNVMIKTLFCTSYDYLLLGRWGEIWKSEDRGFTWDTVYPYNGSMIFESFIEKESVCYTGGREYVGGENSGFYKSEDQGNTWDLISLQKYGITKLIFDLDKNILAGVSISPAGQSNGLYKSTDNGISWQNIYNQQQVVHVAADSLGGYYIGLESSMGGPWGIYYSPDLGLSWQELNAGFVQADAVYDLDATSKYIYCIFLNYKNERILYRSINPIVHIPDIISVAKDEIIMFPNPVVSSNLLSIKNNSINDYCFDVFNEFGNKVNSLKGICITKNSRKLVDVSNCTKGIYLFKFYNNRNVFTKKVIITK